MTGTRTSASGSRRRTLKRALLALAALVLLVAGPTLAFLALWSWPLHRLPGVGAGQESQSRTPGMPEADAAQLMAVLRQARTDAGVPSLSAAIAHVDGRRWAGASGWAEVEGRQPATPASRYRTGSVAKPVTAVALVRLAAEGRIDLDAPAARHVAGLPPALAGLSARQLASHTAGIRHYAQTPQWWPGWHEALAMHDCPDVAAGLDLFKDDPLQFAAGAGFGYSTFGYTLLSRVMEGAAGRPFPELLRQEVLDPAGMVATGVDRDGAMPGRVAFYEGRQGRYTRAHPLDSSCRIAGGGLVSTPTDLARLGATLLGGKLLDEAALRILWTPQPLADGSPNPQHYALGWRVEDDPRLSAGGRPLRVVHHGGSQTGAAAFLLLVPDRGLAVAVMANSGSARGDVEAAAFALAKAALIDTGARPGRN